MTKGVGSVCRSLALVSVTATAVAAQPEPRPLARPRLVVFIAVDQMRADYLDRFRPLYEAGFKRLQDQGAVFTRAFYRHASTATGPGHSVLMSGRSPRSSGIVGNNWYDRTLRRSVNVVGDSAVRVLGGVGHGRVTRVLQRLHCRRRAEGSLPRLARGRRLLQGPLGDPAEREAGGRGLLVRDVHRRLHHVELVHGPGAALARPVERAQARRRPRGSELGAAAARPCHVPALRRRGRCRRRVGPQGRRVPAPDPQRAPVVRLLRRPAAHAVRRRDPARFRHRRDARPRPGQRRADGRSHRQLLRDRRDRPHLRRRQPGADG